MIDDHSKDVVPEGALITSDYLPVRDHPSVHNQFIGRKGFRPQNSIPLCAFWDIFLFLFDQSLTHRLGPGHSKEFISRSDIQKIVLKMAKNMPKKCQVRDPVESAQDTVSVRLGGGQLLEGDHQFRLEVGLPVAQLHGMIFGR